MTTVFVDVDTQLDFMCPAGALYVPGAERIVPAVAKLNRYAAAHGIAVLSTVDAHTEDDPEFHQWPHHCVAGTTGQQKLTTTLIEKRIVIPNREGELQLDGMQQIVMEKQTVDPCATRTWPRILERLKADRYVVFGVATEVCVLNAARGLLATGKPVTLVADAVKALSESGSTRACDEIRSLGGIFSAVAEVCAG